MFGALMKIESRYVNYLFLGAVVSLFFAVFIRFEQGFINIALSVLAFLIGVSFTSLVTIRLPVFRQYYEANTQDEIRKYRGMANEKAAMATTGLLAGLLVGSGMFLLGVDDYLGPAFVAATSASFISLYHEDPR